MQNANTKTKKKRTKIPSRSACPLCGHNELLTEGPDQFCLSCEWDTCAEYVERGWMDHLEIACLVHFPPKPITHPTQPDSQTQNEGHKKPA